MSAHHEHVGPIGERVQFIANVLFAKCKHNDYSYTYFVTLVDDQGHHFKMFYSGRKWLPARGQRIDIKATIAEHDEYQGVAQTRLSHPIVKEIGIAPGFAAIVPTPIPRAEELRFNAQKKAQNQFLTAATQRTH